jgi:hypothetical protein
MFLSQSSDGVDNCRACQRPSDYHSQRETQASSKSAAEHEPGAGRHHQRTQRMFMHLAGNSISARDGSFAAHWLQRKMPKRPRRYIADKKRSSQSNPRLSAREFA